MYHNIGAVLPAPPTPRTYRLELAPDPENLGPVRLVVTAHIRWWGRASLADDAAVCVNELLTNVHQHTGGSCVLTLEETPHGVRITVGDSSPQLPCAYQPDWYAYGRRGMWIVAQLAHRWGAEPTPTGKNVWAELRAAAR